MTKKILSKFDITKNFDFDELAKRYIKLLDINFTLNLKSGEYKISNSIFEELLLEYNSKQHFILDLIKKFEPVEVKNNGKNRETRVQQPAKIIVYNGWLINISNRLTVAYSSNETIHCFKSLEDNLIIEKETFLTWALLRYKFAYRNIEQKNQVFEVNGLHIQFSKMLERDYVKNFSIIDQTFEIDSSLI